MSNRKRQSVQEAPQEPIYIVGDQTVEVSPPSFAIASHSYPAHWVKGQLLDLRKFTDGTARATILGEEYDPQAGNAVHFDSLWAAQVFISTWYQREYQQR